MPEHHDREDGLDDQVVRLDQVAQLGVLFVRARLRPRRVPNEPREQLVDQDFAMPQLLVLVLLFLAEPQRNGDQVSVNICLDVLDSDVETDETSLVELL